MIKLLHDNVLVLRAKPDELTKSGLIITASEKEIPEQGTIVCVGPGIRDKDGNRVKMHVKEGDIALFGKYAGTKVKINDVEYLNMKEEEILGVICE